MMEQEEQSSKRRTSETYFHIKPENWNCAQSVLKGFQERIGLSDAEIEAEFRSKGGGRAPKGHCGALYAANFLMKKYGLKMVSDDFEKMAGSCTCVGIKGPNGTKYPCSSCVKLADDLVQKRFDEQEK